MVVGWVWVARRKVIERKRVVQNRQFAFVGFVA